jgi:hypothetical protein
MQKNELEKTPLIVNGVMTGTSAITSNALNIRFLDNIGVQFNFTGTPTGTFQVLVSADHEQDPEGNVTVPGTFIPVTLSPAPVASGSAGQIYIDLNQLSAPWLEVSYTNASGVGVLNAFATAKAVGG